MLEATLELARRVERCEIEFCAAAGAGPHGGVETLEIGGGLAVCGAAGLPINKVLGLGLGSDVSDADLDALEEFYDARRVDLQIELCPLASPGLAARLTRRGYVLQGFENELARALPANPLTESGECVVAATQAETEDLWLQLVSGGFASAEGSPGPPAPAVIGAIAEVMRRFNHPEIARAIAWLDGNPAGGGASYVRDGVVGIFGTATLPAFRRRGVQRALVTELVNRAIGRADLAIATTEPGSTSQRTFERLGFQVLYTRAILVPS